MQVQCCVCHRVRSGESWLEAPGARREVSHSYCPACHDRMRVQLHNERAARTQPAAVPPLLPLFA